MTDQRQNGLAGKDERIRQAIRSTGEVRANAAFRERLKREFSSGTIAEPAARPDKHQARGLPRWAWLMLPAAAMIVIVALLLPGRAPAWSVQALLGEGRLEVDGQMLSTDDVDTIARALDTGGRVRLPEGMTLDLRLGDRLILELTGGTDATLPAPPERASAAPLLSEVRHGELRLKTGPGFPGSELHILTAEGRTEIFGTIVSVYKGDDYTCVCVLEGTARVGVDESDLEEIPAEKLKIMFAESPPVVMGISWEHKTGLVKFSERYEGVFGVEE